MLPPPLAADTIDALPRHDFKNAFFATLVETLTHAPQSATMTWLARQPTDMFRDAIVQAPSA